MDTAVVVAFSDEATKSAVVAAFSDLAAKAELVATRAEVVDRTAAETLAVDASGILKPLLPVPSVLADGPLAHGEALKAAAGMLAIATEAQALA